LRISLLPKNRIFNIVFALAFVGLSFHSVCAVAQTRDATFREFEREQVPTPQQLVQFLTGLNGQSNQFDSQKFEKLEDLGRKALEGLTPQQRKLAEDLARKYLKGSPGEAKQATDLLDKMGIKMTPEMEQRLRHKYKNQIQDLLDRQSAKNSNQRPSNGQARNYQPPNSQRNRPQANGNSSRTQTPYERLPNDIVPDENAPKPEGRPGLNRDPASDKAGNGKDVGRRDDGERSRFGNRSGASGAVAGVETSNNNPAGSGLDQGSNQRRNGQEQTFPQNQALPQDGKSAAEIQRILDDINNGSDIKKDSQSNQSEKNREKSPGEKSSKGWDRLPEDILKRVVDSQAKRKGLGGSSGSKEKKNALDGSFFERMSETLGGKDKPKSKERLSRRFDRLLVDAAKRSIEEKIQNGDFGSDSDVADSVDSVFDKVIERVHDSIDQKKRESGEVVYNPDAPFGAPAGPPQQNKNNSSPSGPDDPFEQMNGPSEKSDSATGSSPGNGFGSMLEGFKSIEFGGWKIIGLVVGVLAAILLVGFLVLKFFVPKSRNGESLWTKRKSGPIRSPKDLIEAFDFFLLKKFGYKSTWWNANHAANVLKKEAPEHGDQIKELVDDYVEARYSKRVEDLSVAERKEHTAILGLLSKRAFNKLAGVENSSLDARQHEDLNDDFVPAKG
jgi:hypothetical protein